jgi:hypothetical protein
MCPAFTSLAIWVITVKPRRALPVDSVDAGFDGDSGVESGHRSRGSASTGREAIANSDAVDEFGVEGDLLVGGTEDVGEDELGFSILEATLLALDIERLDLFVY